LWGQGLPGAAVGLVLGSWLIFASLRSLVQQTRNAANFISGLKRLRLSYVGMLLAHVGFGCAVIGVSVVSQYSSERDLRLEQGESMEVAGYSLRFEGTSSIKGPNYMGTRGDIRLSKNGREISLLHPEKRRYHARQDQVMTEASIDAGFFRDIYVALGEPLEGSAWAVRVHYKPMVRWLWWGGALIALGGLVAIMDKRYRLQSPTKKAREV
jgi:cytochrome c-type biogenesis protein CcmF